jgi:hypothetical protein
MNGRRCHGQCAACHTLRGARSWISPLPAPMNFGLAQRDHVTSKTSVQVPGNKGSGACSCQSAFCGQPQDLGCDRHLATAEYCVSSIYITRSLPCEQLGILAFGPGRDPGRFGGVGGIGPVQQGRRLDSRLQDDKPSRSRGGNRADRIMP